MHLTIRERERIELYQVAEFARRRLRRGSRISAPEAIAVVCDEILELAWDGASLDEVVAAAYRVVDVSQLLPGVPNLVPQIQVEALFPQGTALVSVDWPFGQPDAAGPGALLSADGDIVIDRDREVVHLSVTNTSDRPVFVSSHFPIAQANSDLDFDRESAEGMRLNIPAGTSATFEPGTTSEVALTPVRRQTAARADV
ncbi:urease subunit beta [Nocardioides hungaricus]